MSGEFLAPRSKEREKLNKLAKFYGVEGFNYQGQDEGETGRARQSQGRPGSYDGAKGPTENRTTEQVVRDINTAMADGAMGDYLRYSGKNLPNVMGDDGEVNYQEFFDLHKEAGKYHKEIGGNNYNNAGSDNFKIANAAFKSWEEDLRSDLTPEIGLDKDDEDDKPKDFGSYYDHHPEFLETTIAKATSGYNADGTPAQQSAEKMLSETLKKVSKDKDKMGLGQFRQGRFVLDNLGSDKYSSGNYSE